MQYASEELRGDREVVLAAMTQDGDALEYASEKLWSDRQFMLPVTEQSGDAVQDDLQKAMQLSLGHVDPEAVGRLIDMGFLGDAVRAALQEAGGNEEMAIGTLLSDQ